jgi:UDP-glucose 4-epimerase
MIDLKNKNILVTGADGFMGSHLTEALIADGARVTALAQYNSFDSHGWLDDMTPAARDVVTLVRGDIRDAGQMRTLCQNQDIVFHLAALISIPYSYDAPQSYIDTNITGTTNILRGALDAGVERLIHTSTSEVYGTAQTMSINETHPLQGQSPYSASKIAADMMAEAFARSFELPVFTLRPFNTFGPRQSERAVISAVIRQVIDPDCTEIRVGDLRPGRAFSFVADTVAAFRTMAGLDPKHSGTVFNAGVDRMISIGELVELIRKCAECDKPVVQEEHRKRPPASEVMALIADSSKLEAATGWRPQVSLEEGITRTIAWWRGRQNQLRGTRDYIV